MLTENEVKIESLSAYTPCYTGNTNSRIGSTGNPTNDLSPCHVNTLLALDTFFETANYNGVKKRDVIHWLLEQALNLCYETTGFLE